MSSHAIFICYSKKDIDSANQIAESLKSAGVNIWIKNRSGNNDDEIQEAIKSSNLFLIVTSNSAIIDETLEQEKKFARDNDIDRLLVLIEPSDIENKMRWNTLASVEYSKENDVWLHTILEKLNIKTTHNKTAVNPTKKADKKPKLDIEGIKNTISIEDKSPEDIVTTSVISADELLNELGEDFNHYRCKINKQIKSTYLGLGALITTSIILLIGLYFFDGLHEFMVEGQEKLKYLGTIGGLIPSTLSTFSYSKIKERKKRRDGIEDFERILSRMKKGLVPKSKGDILALEDDFVKYTKA